jgi:hypothetical protein
MNPKIFCWKHYITYNQKYEASPESKDRLQKIIADLVISKRITCTTDTRKKNAQINKN